MTAAEWPSTTRFRAAVRFLLESPPRPRPGVLGRLCRWIARADPPRQPDPTNRQLLLIVAGLGRLYWSAGRPDDAGHREWVERCERFADGTPTPADREVVPRLDQDPGPFSCPWEFLPYFLALAYPPRHLLSLLPSSSYREGMPAAAVAVADRCFPDDWPAGCDLLREVLGNPFHPARFSPDWRTSAAVELARQMYESRDFGPMPVLADALQDAGCEDAAILGHCRGPGPHVRGCRVVDLILGKS